MTIAVPDMVYARTNLLCWNCSLNQVDIKVFPAFLRYVPYQSDALRRQIINMIVNRLYEASEKGIGNLMSRNLTTCQTSVPALLVL